MTRRFLLSFALILSTAPAALAGIFIPLNYNGPGAYGSQWHTSVVVSNRSQSTLAGPGVLFSQCFVAPDFCGTSYLYPSSTGKLLSDAPRGIYINSEAGDAAFATVHIAAEPRDPDTEGTELPIARDGDFRTSMKLINVPTGVASGHPVRALLRLYALLPSGTGLPTPTGTAFITAYDVKNPSVPAVQIEVTLTANGPNEAGYAEVDLSRFASIAPFVNLDVDAGKLSPTLQLHFPSFVMNVWGFASVTDNATNDVITITAR